MCTSPSGVYGAAGLPPGTTAPGDAGRVGVGLCGGDRRVGSDIARYGLTGSAWRVIVADMIPELAATEVTATRSDVVCWRTPVNGATWNGSLTIADSASPALMLINWLAASTVESAGLTISMT